MNEMIETKCKRCNNNFMISKEKYNHCKKHGTKIICPTCLAISKENKYKKASDTHKKNWANYNKEDRDKRIQNAKDGIHNMSEEAKAKRSKNSSEATKKVMANLTDEQRASRSAKLSIANIKRYANMSDDDKKELGRKISEGQNSRSPEDKIKSNRKRSESLKTHIKNLSPEETAKRNQKVQDWWDNMEIEEFQRWNENRANGYNNYMNDLNINPNHNESDFINYLNLHQFKYQFQCYNMIKHPDFDEIFPNNPVTGAKFVNPYHKWDFKIHTSDKDIFVDIDGSIHFNESYTVTHSYTKITYNILDYNKFNDSKRPYQTDGLDAYVIQCIDDNLTDNTVVINIKTNEKMSFKSFMDIIIWQNMNDDEKRVILKDAI